MTTLYERSRTARVLLIEDNRGDALLTKLAFKRAKMASDVTVAESGESGLSLLRGEGLHADKPRPDLILLDLNLPQMHGLDVLNRLKDDPDLRQIPVVVLSSSSADSDIGAAYARHANGFITKPLSLDDYDHVVSTIEDYWFNLVQVANSNGSETAH